MKPFALLVLLLAGCAAQSASDNYDTPLWTREYCAGIDWRVLGKDDAGRYKDAEKRLAALEQSCGQHMRIDRREYLAGFTAARAQSGG